MFTRTKGSRLQNEKISDALKSWLAAAKFGLFSGQFSKQSTAGGFVFLVNKSGLQTKRRTTEAVNGCSPPRSYKPMENVKSHLQSIFTFSIIPWWNDAHSETMRLQIKFRSHCWSCQLLRQVNLGPTFITTITFNVMVDCWVLFKNIHSDVYQESPQPWGHST